MIETLREFGASMHFGLIEEIDGSAHSVKVYLPALDMLTHWLPLLESSTQDNKAHNPIDKGAQVAILLDPRGEYGCVLGAIYSDVDTPPVTDPDVWHKQFKDGAIIEYNPNTHVLKVDTKGEITIKATGPVTIEAGPSITLKAPLIKLQAGALIELDAPMATANNLLVKGKLIFNPLA